MLLKIFAADFCENIRRVATLIDPLGNQFEVLVEKINGNVYLTWGSFALKDFITFVWVHGYFCCTVWCHFEG
jgi:hypothetical protein